MDLGKPWQSLDLGNISSDGSRECESGNSRVCCNTTSDHKLLELSEHLQRPGVEQGETSDLRSCDVFDGPTQAKQRRVLGELHLENKSIHQKNCEEKVSEEEKSVGRVATSGILSAHRTLSVRWRNGIFNRLSMRELFKTTVMESLATQIVLFMTSYQILMVEELICFWSNYPQLESPTDCGLLAFIDAMVLLTNWLYLGHFPAEPRALSWPNSGHHYWGSTSGNSETVALKL